MATDAIYYFPLSMEHQEVDDTLMGAVRYNAEQDLSASEKAQACANIGATQFGSLLKILGHFDTVAELQTSAPRNVGDAYSVGTATPYNLYIFDGLRKEWLDYGQIRAADISARYVENQTIAVSGWTEDDTVLAGYNYRAQIAISGATEDDFPIVAFDQSDAVSGNYAPLSFSFDGYIEVWAKAKPTAAITIPVATIIANGGNGRGITNATGGITAGSVGTEDLADGSVVASKVADGAVGRAKLALDALFSPRITSGSRNIAASDIGGTIQNTWNEDATYTLTQAISAALPVGAELAVLRGGSSGSLTVAIAGSGGVRFGIPGDTTYKNATLKLTDFLELVAIRKIAPDNTNGDLWGVYGNVEVVT